MNTKPQTKLHSPAPIYLYCLTPAEGVVDLERRGLEPGYPLFGHTFDGLRAVLSGVDLEAFTGPQSEQNLQDIEWIAPRAARHARVVEEMMAESPVLPVRFGTIYSSSQALERALEGHRETIAAFFSELGLRKEFAIKGFMDRQTALDRVADASLAEAAEKLGAMAPGARYFEEKRIHSQSETLLEAWLDHSCSAIARALDPEDGNLVALKLQDRRTSGRDDEMVLNWALLADDPDGRATKESIAAMNREWGPRGITLESSGPWPPYSFCPQLGRENRE